MGESEERAATHEVDPWRFAGSFLTKVLSAPLGGRALGDDPGQPFPVRLRRRQG